MTITALRTPVKVRIGICAAAIVALFALIAAMGSAPAYAADYSTGQSELSTASKALDVGDTFTKGRNKYEVLDHSPYDDDHEGTVMLVKYGSKNRDAVINTVWFKGKCYEVRIVGQGAFKNKRGRKVTTVKIGFNVDRIQKNAFNGCKQLARLNMRNSDVVEIDHDSKGYYVGDVSIGKNAFKNAGTKGLVVLCGNSNPKYQAAYKKALVKKGLRPDATVVN